MKKIITSKIAFIVLLIPLLFMGCSDSASEVDEMVLKASTEEQAMMAASTNSSSGITNIKVELKETSVRKNGKEMVEVIFTHDGPILHKIVLSTPATANTASEMVIYNTSGSREIKGCVFKDLLMTWFEYYLSDVCKGTSCIYAYLYPDAKPVDLTVPHSIYVYNLELLGGSNPSASDQIINGPSAFMRRPSGLASNYEKYEVVFKSWDINKIKWSIKSGWASILTGPLPIVPGRTDKTGVVQFNSPGPIVLLAEVEVGTRNVVYVLKKEIMCYDIPSIKKGRLEYTEVYKGVTACFELNSDFNKIIGKSIAWSSPNSDFKLSSGQGTYKIRAEFSTIGNKTLKMRFSTVGVVYESEIKILVSPLPTLPGNPDPGIGAGPGPIVVTPPTVPDFPDFP